MTENKYKGSGARAVLICSQSSVIASGQFGLDFRGSRSSFDYKERVFLYRMLSLRDDRA